METKTVPASFLRTFKAAFPDDYKLAATGNLSAQTNRHFAMCVGV